jgi:hypothetical protein
LGKDSSWDRKWELGRKIFLLYHPWISSSKDKLKGFPAVGMS